MKKSKSGSNKPRSQSAKNRSGSKSRPAKAAPKKAPPKRSISSGKGSKGKSAGSVARSTNKRSPAKPAQRPAHKAKARSGKAAPPPILRRAPTPEEIQYRKHVVQFESGLKLFNHGAFDKAKPIFDALRSNSAPDLAQRAQMYLNICNQRLARPTLRLKTAEDYYNYAVSMSNQGNRAEAEENLSKALKLSPEADYIYYALAAVQALRGNSEGAMQTLQKAIALNPQNRYLARSDADFDGLGEDPLFTELLYPERPLS